MIVDLNVNNKKAIVVGGGTEGLRKINGLLDQDCEITVITSRLNNQLKKLMDNGKINLVKCRIKTNSRMCF